MKIFIQPYRIANFFFLNIKKKTVIFFDSYHSVILHIHSFRFLSLDKM